MGNGGILRGGPWLRGGTPPGPGVGAPLFHPRSVDTPGGVNAFLGGSKTDPNMVVLGDAGGVNWFSLAVHHRKIRSKILHNMAPYTAGPYFFSRPKR